MVAKPVVPPGPLLGVAAPLNALIDAAHPCVPGAALRAFNVATGALRGVDLPEPPDAAPWFTTLTVATVPRGPVVALPTLTTASGPP